MRKFNLLSWTCIICLIAAVAIGCNNAEETKTEEVTTGTSSSSEVSNDSAAATVTVDSAAPAIDTSATPRPEPKQTKP